MTTPNQPGPSQPTPEERFERAVAGLRELPPTGAVTFRGITSPTGTQPGVVAPRGITATSRDLVVATAGMTSPGIAIVSLRRVATDFEQIDSQAAADANRTYPAP